MKIVFLCFFSFLLLSGTRPLFAQDSSAASPVVTWTYSGTLEKDSVGLLTIHASLRPGWKLFSTTMPEDLPNTRIRLEEHAPAIITTIEEIGKQIQLKEPLLDQALVRYFENEVTFQVRVSGSLKGEVRGSIHYMTLYRDSFPGPDSSSFVFGTDARGRLTVGSAALKASSEKSRDLHIAGMDLANPARNCGGTGVEPGSSRGLWNIFFLGFLGGLIALLTPCVFPMIPLTVSFFTKQTANRKTGIRNAYLYGFFIFMIYTLLSTPFYFLDSLNPEILNNISTNVWLNLFFFLVFILFALSFFGLFEITLPGSLANAVDSRAGTGSIIGIFFMALTLALVSFSCTGPILGSLLAGSLSTQGGAFQLTAGMAGFGLALALPFALFALFPHWLHTLPKSGGWLNTVKIVLGFLEIALAVKFLSNADLVEHWGILKREVFLLIWIIIGFLLVLFLFGFLRLGHETRHAKPGFWRLVAAVFFLVFTLYLVPGLFRTKYANRSLISGFPPPLSYSIYGNDVVRLSGLEAQVRNNYQEALELARKENKPLLIDFTGWACVNCRKMEENVWTDPAVKSLIEKNYILVSLYVDDRKNLPSGEQFIFTTREGNKKEIRTVGDQFATFQSENFANASQPLYAVLSPGQQLMTLPVGYTPNPSEYAAWLRCGLDAFQHAAVPGTSVSHNP